MPEFLANLAQGMQGMGAFAYVVITLVVVIETIILVGHFVPGGVFIAFIGFLCYVQVFDFGSMFLLVFLGHYTGELINYWLGWAKGRALFSPDARWLKLSYLEAAERQFERRGGFILIPGQFVGGLRPFLSFAAGATHYPRAKFAVIMFIGALLWAVMHLGVGFVLGASWQQASGALESLSLVLLVLVLTVWVTGYLVSLAAENIGQAARGLEAFSRKIHRSQRYQAIAARSPALFRILEARLSLSRPWGLSATLGLLLVGVCAFFFVAIFDGVREGVEWFSFDLSFVNLLAQLRAPRMDTFFSFFTHLGDAPTIISMVLAAVVICFITRQWRSAAVIAGTVILTVTLAVLIKSGYGRARPDQALALIIEKGFSFPSGHSSVAVAMFGSLYWWLCSHPGRFRVWLVTAFVVLLSVLLIGFSRIYLGVHYPSDVLAGFSLGTGCLVLTATVVSNIRSLKDRPYPSDYAVLGVLILGMVIAGWRVADRAEMPPALDAVREVVKFDRDVATTTSLLAELPRDSHNMMGSAVLPVTMVVIGKPASLQKHLETAGWRIVKPNAFFSREMAAPVFPVFVDGRPAELTMLYQRDKDRFVLRLWPSRDALKGRPVRLGNIVRERGRKAMTGLTIYKMSPDIDLAAEKLHEGLAPLGEATMVEGFRDRGLYTWNHPFFTHGSVLLLDLKETAN